MKRIQISKKRHIEHWVILPSLMISVQSMFLGKKKLSIAVAWFCFGLALSINYKENE